MEEVADRAEADPAHGREGHRASSTWVWQSGGVASRDKQMLAPEDAKGMKIRGGSREMDLVLKAAGAATLNLPSNEFYARPADRRLRRAHHLLDEPRSRSGSRSLRST